MFRFVVLGLLRRGMPLHGYALMKEYRERAGVQISTGSFYRELQRLVGEGLVAVASNPAGCDPRRTPYEITEEGAAAFDHWLADPLGSGIDSHEDGLSARAVFLPEADAATVAAAVERWHDELWQRGKAIEASREAALRASRNGSPPGFFDVLGLLLARRLKHVAADLEFLAEFRQAYADWTVGPRHASGALRAAHRRNTGAKLPGLR